MSIKNNASFFTNLMSGLTRRTKRQDKGLSATLELLLEASYGSLLESSDMQDRITKAMDVAAAEAAIAVLEGRAPLGEKANS